MRPPRGYCAPLVSALPRDSRCHKHLAATLDKPPAGANHTRTSHQQLVYVRLETLGRKLGELRTGPINELVARGVLGLLLAERPPPAPSDGRWAALRTQLSGGPSGGGCVEAVEALVCRLVYPSCHFRLADISALVRPPCREDCLLARDVMCSHLEWGLFAELLAEAFNETLIGAIDELDLESQGEQRKPAPSPPSVHFYWPHERSVARCESLPSLRRRHKKPTETATTAHETHQDGSPRWPICSSALIQRIGGHQTAAGQSKCLLAPDGTSYSANINHTSSGLECQAWTSQSPHQHPRSELLFESMWEAQNYCRNPGWMEPSPWCYTMDPNIRWQYCNPEPCHQDLKTSNVVKQE